MDEKFYDFFAPSLLFVLEIHQRFNFKVTSFIFMLQHVGGFFKKKLDVLKL